MTGDTTMLRYCFHCGGFAMHWFDGQVWRCCTCGDEPLWERIKENEHV